MSQATRQVGSVNERVGHPVSRRKEKGKIEYDRRISRRNVFTIIECCSFVLILLFVMLLFYCMYSYLCRCVLLLHFRRLARSLRSQMYLTAADPLLRHTSCGSYHEHPSVLIQIVERYQLRCGMPLLSRRLRRMCYSRRSLAAVSVSCHP